MTRAGRNSMYKNDSKVKNTEVFLYTVCYSSRNSNLDNKFNYSKYNVNLLQFWKSLCTELLKNSQLLFIMIFSSPSSYKLKLKEIIVVHVRWIECEFKKTFYSIFSVYSSFAYHPPWLHPAHLMRIKQPFKIC